MMRLPGSPGSLFFAISPPVDWRDSMRALILAGALALASCGGNSPANNAAVAEDAGAAGTVSGNDTTAIDAATGEAANMAADVNYTFNEDSLNAVAANNSAVGPDKPAANNSAD